MTRVATRLRAMSVLLCASAVMATPPATGPTTTPATAAITSNPANLIVGLASADPAERERCERELIALGQTGRAALLEAMESDDPQLRVGAADLILKLPFDRPDDPAGVAGFLKEYGKPI